MSGLRYTIFSPPLLAPLAELMPGPRGRRVPDFARLGALARREDGRGVVVDAQEPGRCVVEDDLGGSRGSQKQARASPVRSLHSEHCPARSYRTLSKCHSRRSSAQTG